MCALLDVSHQLRDLIVRVATANGAHHDGERASADTGADADADADVDTLTDARALAAERACVDCATAEFGAWARDDVRVVLGACEKSIVIRVVASFVFFVCS